MRFSSPICIKKSELQGSWILNSTFYQTGLPSRLTVELKPQYWNVGPQKPHHVCHSFCSYITTRLRVSLNFWLILQYAFLQTPQDAVLLFPSTLHLYRKVLCKSARYITKDFQVTKPNPCIHSLVLMALKLQLTGCRHGSVNKFIHHMSLVI